MDKATFHSKDKTKLVGLWSHPDHKSDKVVVLAHGITVDKEEDGIFTKLARLLADNGFSILRFDFRGHGESQGRSVDMTISKEVEDLTAAIDYIEQRGYKRIGLLGASFGGGISALYAGNIPNKLTCLCLWNPALNYQRTFLKPVTPWLKKQTAQIKRDFNNKGWSTLGSAKLIIGKQLFDEMEDLFPYKSLKKIKIPLLIIHGSADDKVFYEDSVEYGRDIGEVTIIKNATHGFHEDWESKIAYKKTLDFFLKYLD